jgi:hypothetical protein
MVVQDGAELAARNRRSSQVLKFCTNAVCLQFDVPTQIIFIHPANSCSYTQRYANFFMFR